MSSAWVSLLWLYLPIGAFVGFISGLLGVGGGAIMVPVFLLAAHAEGFPAQHAMHMALGTSLACILASTLSSMRAHQGHGAVNADLVRLMAPPIFLAAFAGTFVAAYLPATPLKWMFLLFLGYVAQGLWRNPEPVSRRLLPGANIQRGVAALIGAFSSLVGIGGASLTVAWLVRCSIGMHEAIGTSAALGVPIALAGAIGYAVNGWHVAGLPPASLGFVYLPAFVGVTLTSFAVAPIGARTAHRLPVRRLRRIFALVLGIVSLRMLASQLGLF